MVIEVARAQHDQITRLNYRINDLKDEQSLLNRRIAQLETQHQHTLNEQYHTTKVILLTNIVFLGILILFYMMPN